MPRTKPSASMGLAEFLLRLREVLDSQEPFDELLEQVRALRAFRVRTLLAEPASVILPASVPMLLFCPMCHGKHIDEGEFATKIDHSHACQHCGLVWRPALVATTGVAFLPGFKNS